MNKKKKDYLVHSLLYQFIICVILFGSFYGLKMCNSDIYNTIKNDFYSNIDENIIYNNASSNDNEKRVTFEQTTEISLTENKEAPIKEKNDNNSKNENEKTTQLSAQIKATGGKDYSVKNEKSIPENVSVNNYSLSQSLVLPVKGELTSGFGLRNHPITGKLRFHAGVDIGANKGTPIYSSYDGVVITAAYDSWNGNYIKIKHENNIMTVYCHCDKLKVKKGDKVKAGQVIATIGSTGSSTGPHLHYELRINNVSYDPEIAFKTAISGI